MTLSYGSYLKLDELLALQDPASDEHDEILFIIIHQVYELWFKEFLHELDHLIALFDGDHAEAAHRTLTRLLTILKLAVAQTDVLETMTPLDFSSFRDRLETASGSQSYQFREIEFALGIKNAAVIEDFPKDTGARARLEARIASPSLWDALVRYLSRRGFDVPDDVIGRTLSGRVVASESLQPVLIEVYRTDPVAMELCERLVDLDEGIQEWRYRHVKMVERTIGTKRGTGGSSGVEFLKKTLFDPAFPDLWAIRADL